jgi:outer membrane cobalamin receptor
MNDQFVTMKPYWLGNLDLKYKIKQNAEAFLNVANLLNKNYERIKGYGEEKISFYGGVNYKF